METDTTTAGACANDIAHRPCRNEILKGLALIGVVIAGIVGMFAYLRGAFSPAILTADKLTDALEQSDGHHPGFRRNHAKGVGVTGYFESNGQGERLSQATVFRAGRVPVIGRFSQGGGQPDVPDSQAGVHGLGLEFTLPNGELWRMAMINLPVFPFRTPEAFYENLVASKPDPKTGKPDPKSMQAFLAKYPETARAFGLLKVRPISSSLGNATYYGLNSFIFTNDKGTRTPARWELIPEQAFKAATTTASPVDKNFLFDELIAQVNNHWLRWHLILVVGESGDEINDATIPWPQDRERIDAGTLVINEVQIGEAAASNGITFDPLVLPTGIAASDDPLLSARSAAYMRSYTRRANETKAPSTINSHETRE